MDSLTIAIGGIVILPLIISLIQLCKRFAPNAPGNLWLGLSFLLAIVFWFFVFVLANGGELVAVADWGLSTWLVCVVQGLAFGLAASKTYDEAERSRGAVGQVMRGIAGQ